jgi:hypothetical protein
MRVCLNNKNAPFAAATTTTTTARYWKWGHLITTYIINLMMLFAYQAPTDPFQILPMEKTGTDAGAVNHRWGTSPAVNVRDFSERTYASLGTVFGVLHLFNCLGITIEYLANNFPRFEGSVWKLVLSTKAMGPMLVYYILLSLTSVLALTIANNNGVVGSLCSRISPGLLVRVVWRALAPQCGSAVCSLCVAKLLRWLLLRCFIKPTPIPTPVRPSYCRFVLWSSIGSHALCSS